MIMANNEAQNNALTALGGLLLPGRFDLAQVKQRRQRLVGALLHKTQKAE